MSHLADQTADLLRDLRAAAARKWAGNPSAQQAGLFARAADEIERLRVPSAVGAP